MKINASDKYFIWAKVLLLFRPKKKYNNLPWIYKIRCCTMYIISHLSLLNVCFSSAAFGTMDLLLRLLKSNIYNVKTIRIKLHSLASWFFAYFLSCCVSIFLPTILTFFFLKKNKKMNSFKRCHWHWATVRRLTSSYTISEVLDAKTYENNEIRRFILHQLRRITMEN